MSIKEILEPIIITYNRKDSLENTLRQLVLDDCPIKDCEIKILDNCSTDGTKEFCEKFCAEYNNFTYIRNSKNIGISGNIIEAMKIASKKWLWILCDDDDFYWSGWDEIEEALYKDYDAVHTTYSENYRSEEYSYLINEEAFIPSVIYKTDLIDSTVLQNAYIMAYTLLPHHAIGCKIINQKGKIFVPQTRHVIQKVDIEKKDWVRGNRDGIFHRLNNYHILSGYIGAYSLIKDKDMREKCCDVLCLGKNFENSMNWFLETNPQNSLYNIFEILLTIDNEKKEELLHLLGIKSNIKFLQLIKFMMTFYLKENHEYFSELNNYIGYNLFVNLFKKIKKFIYNMQKTAERRQLTILGIKIKTKRGKNVNKR